MARVSTGSGIAPPQPSPVIPTSSTASLLGSGTRPVSSESLGLLQEAAKRAEEIRLKTQAVMLRVQQAKARAQETLQRSRDSLASPISRTTSQSRIESLDEDASGTRSITVCASPPSTYIAHSLGDHQENKQQMVRSSKAGDGAGGKGREECFHHEDHMQATPTEQGGGAGRQGACASLIQGVSSLSVEHDGGMDRRDPLLQTSSSSPSALGLAFPPSPTSTCSNVNPESAMDLHPLTTPQKLLLNSLTATDSVPCNKDKLQMNESFTLPLSIPECDGRGADCEPLPESVVLSPLPLFSYEACPQDCGECSLCLSSKEPATPLRCIGVTASSCLGDNNSLTLLSEHVHANEVGHVD